MSDTNFPKVYNPNGYGDPRCCPRHPGERIVSDCGSFDAPCWACEGEADEEDRRLQAQREAEEQAFALGCTVEEVYARWEAVAVEAEKARETARAAAAAANSDIPF